MLALRRLGLGLVIWPVPCLILLFGSDYRQVPVVQTAGKCPIEQLTDLQAQAMLRYCVARHNDGLTDLKAIGHTCRISWYLLGGFGRSICCNSTAVNFLIWNLWSATLTVKIHKAERGP
jgi:hypothetical protein